MHILVASAAIWLIVMYVVAPVAQFLIVIGPWLLGGLVLFGVVSLVVSLSRKHPISLEGDEREPSNLSIKASTTTASKPPANSSDIYIRVTSKKNVMSDLPQQTGPVIAPKGVPSRGLVIASEPLDKILQGRKTMELRGKHNRQLGPVALIRKGSGKIYAVADIVESIGPMSFETFRAEARRHAVEPERMRDVYEKWKYGWVLKNLRVLREPVPYVHKGMSQVNLDQQAIDGLVRQLALSQSGTSSRRSLP